MSAFAAQVVPGCSEWLTRPNYTSGMRSDHNQQMDTVTDSPPSTAYQLDYKYPVLMNVKQDPDEIDDFCRSGLRQSTVVTSSSSYGCIEDSVPRSRRLFSDELRLKRDWLIANGYRDNHASGNYGEPEASEKDSYRMRRLPAVDELMQLQNDVIGVRDKADVISTQQRFAADEPVDLSLIDQVNVKDGGLPPWNMRHVTQQAMDQDQYRLLSCYSLEEQRNVLQRSGQLEAMMRERAAQRLPAPPSSPAVNGIARLPKRDIPDENEGRDEVEYQPRRLTFAEHFRGRDFVRGMAPVSSNIDEDDKRSHHNILIKQKFDFDRRQSLLELHRNVGNGELKSRSTGVNHERRQTWPLDAPTQPQWFRRHHQLDTSNRLHSPAVSDTITAIRRDETVGSGEFPVVKTDRCRTNGEERSPMAELIQLYDVTMASRARNQPTGCDARQATTSKAAAADDGDDEIMSTGLPSANDQLDDDSMNSVGKKYVCHICPFVGDEKEQFDSHMKVHFDHWCPSCNYSSRTEGRLRCHIKMFHSELENAVATESGVNKKRQKSIITCRHCDFSTKIKEDLWLHMRQHIQPDKMLECPRCTFVTDLKHHLEYHLRSSHIGSKPYKCDKCTYRCFNQSMLNSHAKSHTNVYQFRCRDCSFAAKYCHALKVHIRRYGHEAAPVLNEDGSQPTDGSGDFALVSRRGRPRGTRGQRDMPRFRSVRQRQQSDMDLIPSNSLSKSAADANFNDTDVHHNAVQFNVKPDMDRRFYPSSSQMAAAAVTRKDDGLYETVAGVLPSFSKFAANVAVGLPELFVSNVDSRTRVSAFPERYDVTVPSRYPPEPGNTRDVEIDCYLDNRRNRETVPDSLDSGANVYLMNGSIPYVIKQPSAPSTFVNYTTASIPSPVLEPEPAQCGDLPLDLTLATKSPQSDKTYHSQSNGQREELVNTDIIRNTDTASPDDYDQVFRRRRHFRNWFQTQSVRQNSLNGSTTADQQTTSSENSTSPRSAVFGYVPDIEFHQSPSTQFKTEVLDDIDGTQTADDDNKFESQQSYEADRLERKAVHVLSTEPFDEEESLQCESSLRGSPSHEGASRGISSPSWVASGRYQCSHCEIDFHGSRTLHAIHMGYHSNDDPFQCNVCGEKTNDRVAFFIHLARVAHN